MGEGYGIVTSKVNATLGLYLITLVTKCGKGILWEILISKNMTMNKQKYDNEYAKQNYDRCIFNVQKGKKSIIEKHWKMKGYKSLNAYINDLIDKDMKQRVGEGSGQNADDEKILGGG